MTEFLQEINSVFAMLILYVSVFSAGERKIIKNEKHKNAIFLSLIVFLFLEAISIYLILFFPLILMFFWLGLSMSFLIISVKSNWNDFYRLLYNVFFILQILIALNSILIISKVQEKMLTNLGIAYHIQTKNYVDSDGDESSRDIIYSKSGNVKLDNFLNNYFVIVFSIIVSVISLYIIELDRRLREKILKLDKLELEKRNKEQEYLEE
jgi:hypothetical protein